MRHVFVSAGRACAGGRPGQTGHRLAELREREAGHAGDVVGGARGRLWGRAERVSAVRDGTERAVGRRRRAGGLRTSLRVPAGEQITTRFPVRFCLRHHLLTSCRVSLNG